MSFNSYPPLPSQVFSAQNTSGQIADWEERLVCVNRVGDHLSEFLQAAFPGSSNEAKRLGDAVAEYLGHGFQKQIDGLKAFQVNPPNLNPYCTVEALARFVRERDGLQAQLDQMEAIAEKFLGSEKTDLMADMIRAQITMLDLPRKIEEVNERITAIQKDLEKQEA